MESENQSGSQEPVGIGDHPPVQSPPVTFSFARVLLTLSITCPIMVALLSGYDYRVRMVPLANAVFLLAPLVGFSAYLTLPRRAESEEQPDFGARMLGGVLLLAFYLVFIMSHVGVATIRH